MHIKELDRCDRGKDCYAMRILENQSDFLHEKSQLEIKISKREDECIINPKFHCELDYTNTIGLQSSGIHERTVLFLYRA